MLFIDTLNLNKMLYESDTPVFKNSGSVFVKIKLMFAEKQNIQEYS